MNIILPHQPIIDFDTQEGGVFVIDKPLTWTSFDVVNKVRYALAKEKRAKSIKVGHAGTLDPLATGILILCVGRYTKQINIFQDENKVYTGTFDLGYTTPSFDLETLPNATFDTGHINHDLIQNTIKKFIGTIDQTPPIYSAIKVNGKNAFDLARAGKTPELKARNVNIYHFDVELLSQDKAQFEVKCSKGTYIRTLIHDLGADLKAGATLTTLTRTASGSFTLDQAWQLNDLILALNSNK